MRPRLQRQRNATPHRHVGGGLAPGVQLDLVPTVMEATVIPGGMTGAHHRIEGVHRPLSVLPMRPLLVGFHIFLP